MFEHKKVSIVIPTYNEAESIRAVIDGFFALGVVDEVIAVDNNARGNTAEEILKTKAQHVRETEHQGYGHAIMRGLREATGDLIVVVEADGTFDPRDLEKFLLYSRDFDVVFGSRTSRATVHGNAFMPESVRIGNWAVAKFLEFLHNGTVITDVGCTYRLLSRSALEKIKPHFSKSNGDGRFSPEMMVWIFRSAIKAVEIPVMYKERIGQSMYTGSVRKAAFLGLRMIFLIIRYRFMHL